MARCNGKAASATAGHDQAASALARKLWPTLTVKLARMKSGDSWEYSVVSSMMHTPVEHAVIGRFRNGGYTSGEH